ncbi:thiamine phosphate phosphatase-like protein [Ananas comosus]|uniref:Inorganic pyrophosphatase 2 n=1 Tax=Ananas comosus TaxID=4615 RepID=A0A199W546_ANACO|nr:thiamine phosphate phosphatase-like protein [Ananas comosus]OAY84434.1 Inorganic pyrophosphatase 2 [Ananas comosus]
MAATIVVFDFDYTIIDCDSDNLVVDDLGGTALFNELLKSMSWNSAAAKMMRELHLQGRSIDEITQSLRRAPLPRSMIAAIKTAYALGCELKIVSDANMFFIETILKHHELIDCFSEIITNPSYVDEEGKLTISPYHDFATRTHGCGLCPPNLCKGMIIERIRSSALAAEEKKRRLIYVGDGKGDYCPSLKLSERDCLMPRKHFPLWELIYSGSTKALVIKAEIHEWTDAEELERVLLRLIGESVSSDGRCDASRLLPADCKPRRNNMLPSSHDAPSEAPAVPS